MKMVGKHIQKSNKHIKKNCAPSWLYLQDYTGMQGQQNKMWDPIMCALTECTMSVC